METPAANPGQLARCVGVSFLLMIGLGIIGAMTISDGIDVNMTADPAGTAANMLNSETALRAQAYLASLGFALSVFISAGLFLILNPYGRLLAIWSFVIAVAAAILSLMGSVYSLNAAEIAGNAAYQQLASDTERWLLAALQATSDYTSFHLSIVLSSAANAGFFFLFFKANIIPRLISGWGVLASLFVASMVVARDFVPALGSDTVTMAFMLSNMVALVSLAMYLLIWGVQISKAPA